MKGDRLLTAFAYSASGPGWSNAPIVAVVMNPTHDEPVRLVWVQPQEQTQAMSLLYAVSAAASTAMASAVAMHLGIPLAGG